MDQEVLGGFWFYGSGSSKDFLPLSVVGDKLYGIGMVIKRGQRGCCYCLKRELGLSLGLLF